MEQGIYDISIEDYHAGDGVSRSQLIELRKAPIYYHYKYISGEYVRPAAPKIIKHDSPLEFGNALHTYILEHEFFMERYHIIPKVNRATSVGKQIYNDALIETKTSSKQILCESSMDMLHKMKQSVDNHEDAKILLEEYQSEKSFYWVDPDTGIPCKSRPDIWGEGYIADLKTCQTAEPYSFQKEAAKFGYHIQAGMIKEAFKHVLGEEINKFFFIAVEKTAPYAVAVYQLDDLAVEQGVLQFKRLLMQLKKCQEQNKWTGYPTSLISIPHYASEEL